MRRTTPDIASRRRILERVRAQPGLHLRALADTLGMHPSTLAYHCRLLARDGQLTVRAGAGRTAYYPAEGLDRRDRDLLHLVVRGPPRTICAHLLEHPGATPGDLKRALAVSGPYVTFHLNRLRAANVVQELPEGRTKRLYIGDAQRLASVLASYPHLREAQVHLGPSAAALAAMAPAGPAEALA